MIDLSPGLGAYDQGSAALDLAGHARAFATGPGVLSGLRLIDTVTAMVGIERVTGQLAGAAFKLALKGDRASEDAAGTMVEAMRARVPVDSGRLLNGIGWRKEGSTVIVEASAVRGDVNYPRYVEFGHHAGSGHADAAFFAGQDHAALRGPAGAGASEVRPAPFFWGSVREGLAQLRGEAGTLLGEDA
ncbi:HK97 gp10 family phage protein [Methylobacterium oryzihabitans]|uniref:HK97 gp10 family phage protein n=1 Tax=Methylobacterium oryzihabitans TaxID=2499852 RepID=A0A3S2VPA7_9HYPH|nr:HK97 gp10 family phage protein [Methylobacterium oryzihabitans]RVU17498.1 HK97 gp10 family phage protein [Methylobacterium oryzihabitans]